MTDAPKEKKYRWLDRLAQRNPTAYFFVDLFFNIAVIVILVYVVRTFLISPFQVYGPSMCDTLNEINGKCRDGFGEYLIVNKAVYYPFFGHRYGTPERGDIIVFRPPHNEKDFYIKRIIGLPGEKVRIQNGKVLVFNKQYQSGLTLPEAYLNSENKNQTFTSGSSQLVQNYEVPEGQYFVMGDNRKHSTDSRHCFRSVGDGSCDQEKDYFLPIDRIEGKATVVLWPLSKIRILKQPGYAE